MIFFFYELLERLEEVEPSGSSEVSLFRVSGTFFKLV